MNTLTVLDDTGDYTVAWDPSKDDEVELARAQFDSLRERGYLIFALTEARDFDPMAGRYEVRVVSAPAPVPAKTPTKRPRERRGLSGAKGAVTRDFDPAAERSVAVPPMVGG